MPCAACGGKTEDIDRFCGSCGAPASTAAADDAICVGCGSELGAEEAACSRCGAPARGARFHEPCVLPQFRTAEWPKACCCCLAEATRIEPDSAAGQGLDFELQIPWCEGCTRRRDVLKRLALAAGLAAGIPALWAAVSHALGGFGCLTLAALAAASAFMAVIEAVPRVAAAFSPRGHVRGCAAYGGAEVLLAEGTGKFFGSVTFRNRAFAQMFERMNRK